MTGGAAGELLGALDFVLGRQLFAGFRLVIRGFPIHVENLVAWPQNRLRIAMAVQAPLHLQIGSLENQGHLVDLPVTRRAAHAFIDVDAVVEINVIGEPVHAHPLDGFVGAVTFAHWLQVTGGVEQHGMAIHAGLGGRNAGGRGGFDAGMTVAAIDAVIADMVFVAELDRLLAHHVLVRQVGGAGKPQHSREAQAGQKKPEKDTESGDEIRTAVKNLRHVNFRAFAVVSSAEKGSRNQASTSIATHK
jgi:hypothetical protein